MSKISTSLSMVLLLALLNFIYQLTEAVYLLHSFEPPGIIELLYRAGFLCGIVWWLKAEARTRNLNLVYCPGLFAQLAWPILVPYYLFKSRGFRGLWLFVILISSFVLGPVVATLIYLTYSVAEY